MFYSFAEDHKEVTEYGISLSNWILIGAIKDLNAYPCHSESECDIQNECVPEWKNHPSQKEMQTVRTLDFIKCRYSNVSAMFI